MRFDVIHPPAQDLEMWRRSAAEARARGYTGVLCPDVPGAVDPFAALACVASAEPDLRIGTFVAAAALHDPDELADRALALAAEAPGRLDFGIGTGRPQTRAAEPGSSHLSGATLRRRIEQVVRRLRQADPGIPVTIAAAGSQALTLAGRLADELSLALPPDATEDTWLAAVDQVRAQRAEPLGVTVNLLAVGDRLPDWHAGRFALQDLRDRRVWALLPGDPLEARQTLAHWRERAGVSRVVVDLSLMDAAQPVIDAAAASAG